MIYSADKYYRKLNNTKVICVDFDNTICLDEWPNIGPVIPGAFEVLRSLQEAGHKLILYTQRSSHYPICCKELHEYNIANGGFENETTVDILTPAIKICNDNGIGFWDINRNLKWEEVTGDNSRKVFMDYLIDDHVMATDRYQVKNSNREICKFVNWWHIDKFCVHEGLYKEEALPMSHMKFYTNYVRYFIPNSNERILLA